MIKKMFVGIINLYRKYISNLKKPCCRFYPTCSKYAIDAINKYGVIKGGFMAFWRVLRCNPFNPGGYDPVK